MPCRQNQQFSGTKHSNLSNKQEMCIRWRRPGQFWHTNQKLQLHNRKIAIGNRKHNCVSTQCINSKVSNCNKPNWPNKTLFLKQKAKLMLSKAQKPRLFCKQRRRRAFCNSRWAIIQCTKPQFCKRNNATCKFRRSNMSKGQLSRSDSR